VTAVIGGIGPSASLAASPLITSINETVDFTASGSSDPDGTITRYLFDFGDGTNSGWVQKAQLNHTYSRPGIYNATVKVTDDDGFSSAVSAPVTIAVKNRPPIAGAVATPSSGNTSTNFRLAVSPSTGDPDGYIVSYEWDFGDGQKANGTLVYHQYQKVGAYNVKLRVTDNYGDYTEVATNVSVLNRGPFIRSTAPAQVVNLITGTQQAFSVDAADPENDTLAYTWSLNGAVQPGRTGASFDFKPAQKGQYKLAVNISDGQYSVPYEWTVVVANKKTPVENVTLEPFNIAIIILVIAVATGAGVYLFTRKKKGGPSAAPPPEATPLEPQ
jgi:PKD repeat protein